MRGRCNRYGLTPNISGQSDRILPKGRDVRIELTKHLNIDLGRWGDEINPFPKSENLRNQCKRLNRKIRISYRTLNLDGEGAKSSLEQLCNLFVEEALLKSFISSRRVNK
jgi:hypothetical protein